MIHLLTMSALLLWVVLRMVKRSSNQKEIEHKAKQRAYWKCKK